MVDVGAAFSRDKKDVAFNNSSGYLSGIICWNFEMLHFRYFNLAVH
jgi:hypothetical protein